MNAVVRAATAAALSFSLGAWLGISPAQAETHALIMTIGAYKNGVPQLGGVRFDAASAKTIAERMGVKDVNMRFYKDDELTLEGMRKAFADLDERVAPGDQVFVYYSGHGTRQKVSDPTERCAEALVTVDGEGFTDTEMEAQLKRLSSKAQKIIALLDACHSGGVTTRSVGPAKGAPLFSAKFAPRSGSDSCERPVNVLTRSISQQLGTRGAGANNYVYIAAARDNEVSLDMPSRGGVATQAWRDCMTSAPDRDGSGGLSAEEIRVCAQDRINTMLKGVQGFAPHNVNITGNANAVLAFANQPAPAPVAQPAKPAPAPLVQQPKPVPAPAPVAAVPVAPSPVVTAPVPVPAPVAPVAMPVAPPQKPASPPVASAPAPVPPAPAPAPVAVAPAPPKPQPSPVAAVPQPAKPLPSATAAPAFPPAYYTLNDILNSRDDRRVVTLDATKPAFKIGVDDVSFTLTSSHAGYLYLMMVGSDGKTFDMLFPNQIDSANAVEAGQPLKLPRAAWQIKAGGPPGKNYLLALVADAPRDFSRTGMQPAGPFSMVAATPATSKDIQLVSNTSSSAGATECSDPPAKRTLQIQRRCSNAYGAALVTLEEVN